MCQTAKPQTGVKDSQCLPGLGQSTVQPKHYALINTIGI